MCTARIDQSICRAWPKLNTILYTAYGAGFCPAQTETAFMDIKKVFIGVAWPYVNGDLHIGHLAGYLLPADFCARFNRKAGRQVLMVSGSDCNGTPVALEAEARKLSPADIIALYHPKNLQLFEQYGISFDNYTTTITANHAAVTQDFFVKLALAGYITKGSSRQYFCASQNKFLPDRYVEGKCPHCGALDARGDQCDACGKVLEQGELIEPKSKLGGDSVTVGVSEHYYFDLKKLEPFLKEYVAQYGPSWRQWIYKETMGWLDRGLEPRCITRDMDWGIKIPVERLPEELRIQDADKKRIYVWFDAVIGYLSAAQECRPDNWMDFWGASPESRHYYFMGKDNLFFHTLLWPGELHACDTKLHLPDFPAINNFLNLEGRKFSKSRGVTVDSAYIGKTYGEDLVRFYLALIMPETGDASFSWQHFSETANSVAIGTYGNFINRVLSMAAKTMPTADFKPSAEVLEKADAFCRKAYAQLSSCEFKGYAWTLVELADFGNKYVDRTKPWAIKDEAARSAVNGDLLLLVLALAMCSEPLVPHACDTLYGMLGVKLDEWPEQKPAEYLLAQLGKVKITAAKPLFAKVPPEAVEAERAKINIA